MSRRTSSELKRENYVKKDKSGGILATDPYNTETKAGKRKEKRDYFCFMM
jgi:hypothetical protein